MAWIKRNGEQVKAVQFGVGEGKIPSQKQEWDRDGCYYTVVVGRQKIRLSAGDWVCLDDDRNVIDVQSNGKFTSEHVMDATVAKKEKPRKPSPVVAMTTEDYEASKAAPKLIADAPEPEPPVEFASNLTASETVAKRKPGRPKGAKNKPKAEAEALEEL